MEKNKTILLKLKKALQALTLIAKMPFPEEKEYNLTIAALNAELAILIARHVMTEIAVIESKN